ncbi:unnamed protein product [Nippostrongylus brasiliensis]|uniref:Transmembrane protein n=1 Tax=Nippostrongylus brasiliensis TaxID=27835 RepID=A0A0N4YBZ1_NIPBR|nr:unnamed protein product [Nippostrongylus brasiliensis]
MSNSLKVKVDERLDLARLVEQHKTVLFNVDLSGEPRFRGGRGGRLVMVVVVVAATSFSPTLLNVVEESTEIVFLFLFF